MHPENKFINGYDFVALAMEFPELKPFLINNEYGKPSLDFGKKECVRQFNKILLNKYYDIKHWDIPEYNLCPTVPGRADYLHYLRDILGTGNKRILDIGTGASIIYPLLGNQLFLWDYVATDVDKYSLANGQNILDENDINGSQITLRLQENQHYILAGVVNDDDYFDACICNPPFFESEKQALRWNEKKWKASNSETIGTLSELICEGGEKTFITNMINESIQFQKQIKLFTCLVSKKTSIPFMEKSCKENGITDLDFIELKTGRKLSRIAVWKF